jgi:hypothetical protein
MKPTISMEGHKVSILSNGWLLFLLSALFIYSGVCIWLRWSDEIKAALRAVQGWL